MIISHRMPRPKRGCLRYSIVRISYCLSANYFGDLLKKETGMSPLKHIQQKMLDAAKERVFDTKKSISEISCELGFPYPQHFSRWFKKMAGCTPNEYRTAN